MSNPYFAFKQFVVHHDRCAMKVGTDGVLLGAWAPVEGKCEVLDVGTGTGLIALMLAQRNHEANIHAIDIDEGAIEQARINAEASPWKERISVELADYSALDENRLYDLIVSNPPYFVNSLKCPDKQRNMARHTDRLPFDLLIRRTKSLLSSNGVFAVVIPVDAADEFIQSAQESGLYLQHETMVIPTVGASPKRALLSFVKHPTDTVKDELLIELSRHVYSDDYISLTKEFYLKM